MVSKRSLRGQTTSAVGVAINVVGDGKVQRRVDLRCWGDVLLCIAARTITAETLETIEKT